MAGNFGKVEVARERALVTLEKLDTGGELGLWVVVTFPKLEKSSSLFFYKFECFAVKKTFVADF